MVEMDVSWIPTIKSLQFNSNIRVFTYDELDLQKCLGKGVFVEVYESRWKGMKIAIKVLKWGDSYNKH